MIYNKLWLDDWRLPPGDGWIWAKTVDDAKAYLEGDGIEEASLDHDLGACAACLSGMTADEWLEKHSYQAMPNCEHFGTGTTLVNWMEETGHWPKVKPKVHSLNPVGRARMQQVIDKHYDTKPEDGPAPKMCRLVDGQVICD